jgi:hypothetical protein
VGFRVMGVGFRVSWFVFDGSCFVFRVSRFVFQGLGFTVGSDCKVDRRFMVPEFHG